MRPPDGSSTRRVPDRVPRRAYSGSNVERVIGRTTTLSPTGYGDLGYLNPSQHPAASGGSSRVTTRVRSVVREIMLTFWASAGDDSRPPLDARERVILIDFVG